MSNVASTWETLRQRVLSTDEVRQIDQIATEQFAMHSLVLMENAGLACVRWLEQKFSNRKPSQPRTVILCGSGNNGGDGLVIARHLRVLGWPTDVFLLGPDERLSADAQANARILVAGDATGIRWWEEAMIDELKERLSQAELVIDAMLGTGAVGNPRPPLDRWITAANTSPAFRLAIDIPTGLNAQTGEPGEPTFAADATLTFVALKPAMVDQRASNLFGELAVLPIGIPETLMRNFLREHPQLSNDSYQDSGSGFGGS